jgi:hypothetical protein
MFVLFVLLFLYRYHINCCMKYCNCTYTNTVYHYFLKILYNLLLTHLLCVSDVHCAVMSTHASVLVDSVGPPSVEVCRAAASFP